MIDPDRLRAAYETARSALLAERTPEGYWLGELADSALSTATAVGALSLVRRHDPDADHSDLVRGGLRWLVEHQNADGGWGDTVRSFSNISTTMLCRAAFHLAGAAGEHAEALRKAEAYLAAHFGRTPEELAGAVRRRYGKDRTFAVPILTTCALAGLVSWREVQSLPFELACLPQSWYRFARLPVVSYALPALIAIGQCVHHHRKPRNPLTRLLRRVSREPSLRVLRRIQPESGGFIEAVPLTSFVIMSLAGIGRADHPVARKGVEFLVNGVRPDGSWPIDSNLSVWVTTLSVNALAAAGDLEALEGREKLLHWLLGRQGKERHPYTGAEPGAWGWSHLSGSVPDCDDTPGAMLALSRWIPDPNPDWLAVPGVWAAVAGAHWLVRLQNRDGGWPTFCRGWGKLPFDRSGSDLTAHALRALCAWQQSLEYLEGTHVDISRIAPSGDGHWGRWLEYRPTRDVRRAIERGLAYLAREQRPDGSWLPLWFGNQHAPDDINPVYGTARVLAAYRDLGLADSEQARGGVAFLLNVQNPDGGWGGAKDTPPSVEETALAAEVLLDLAPPGAMPAVWRGVQYLVERVEAGGLYEPAPIGFYFAKLWYFEKLYPIIFSVGALGRALRKLENTAAAGA